MSSETENSVKSLLPHVAESDGSGSMHARVWLPICSLSGRDRCFGVLEVNSNARNAKSKGIEFSDAKSVGLDFIGPLDIINTTPSEIITAATANNIIVPAIKFVCEQHGICSSHVWVCGVDHSYEFLRNVAIKWLEYHNVGTPYSTYCDLCSVFPNGGLGMY
ncbi:hypothetical protein HanRHA438_Chr02g0083831 [Helianthus annuus]|nr:hypothetical protein HanRHA438_Chr02g0083831 [Helianthus annuus]